MAVLTVRTDLPASREERKSILTSGLEAGISSFILRKEDSGMLSLGLFEPIYAEDIESVDITDPSGQERAMSFAGKKDVLISAKDWKVIPFENIIAGFAGSGTRVLAQVSSPEEAELFASVMEKGVDFIVVEAADIGSCASIMDSCPNADLVEVTVTGVRQIETGDRVCVDTCSMMDPGEGMLIGSYSGCLFLVQSESEENGYVASRPFRVNAGAVHSYTELPGGRTSYLSELKSGDTVLICGRSGGCRKASVGRCKIERRPLLMISAEYGGEDYTVVLQNAETVKLVGKDGAVSVTSLKKGDRVLAKVSSGGRHFGMAVDETVSER